MKKFLVMWHELGHRHEKELENTCSYMNYENYEDFLETSIKAVQLGKENKHILLINMDCSLAIL